MSVELIALVAEKALGIETIRDAALVADFGAVKPKEYGTLTKLKKMRADVCETTASDAGIERLRLKELVLRFEETTENTKQMGDTKNPYLLLRPQEVAKDVAEYLCDNDITPSNWEMADSTERMKMLEKAKEIMAKELRLPEEWQKSVLLEVVSMPPNEKGIITSACATYHIRSLPNGGVNMIEIPKVLINEITLAKDYYNGICVLFHEMIHVKQFASVDGVDPTKVVDIRLLDLIEDLKKTPVGIRSRAEYLASPFEAEAWAQSLYFKEMLQAVVKEL